MSSTPRIIALPALLAVSLLFGGCSGNIFSIHRIDIEQGNIIEPAAVDELSPGMTRKQVLALMGHPVLEPVLNPDRWEYVYYRKLPDKPVEKNTVIVYFDKDRISRISRPQP